jgi:hypothetical protein
VRARSSAIRRARRCGRRRRHAAAGGVALAFAFAAGLASAGAAARAGLDTAPAGTAPPRAHRRRARADAREILREAARPRRIPREAPPAPDIAPVVRGIGGCLVRLVLFGLFLIVALFIGLFVFGGALLQMFRPYY